MKKELLVLAMAIGMVAAVSANGQQDDEGQFYGRGPGMSRGYNADTESREDFREQRQADMAAEREARLAEQEVISVSGTLNLVNGELPTVESDGVTYTVMAPWNLIEEIELTDGMNVSVEGYEMPGRPLQWDDSEVALMLTKAVIDGEEIEIEHPADGEGLRGGRNGGKPMGGRGNAGGGMMGRRG